MPAHRSIGASLASLGLAVVALAGCGQQRQDKDEPKGDFPVEIVDASFPPNQRLAKTSNLEIVVRNPGSRKIPIISVTIKCAAAKGGSGGSPSDTSGGASGFAYRTTYPNVADPARPRFIVNRIPTRTPRVYDQGRLDPLERSSAYVDTFPLGSLAPGRSVTFRWNVTAVKSGPYRICYRVNAGLNGKARAVPAQDGEPIDGEFTGEIKQKAAAAHIAEDGKTVVEGSAGGGP